MIFGGATTSPLHFLCLERQGSQAVETVVVLFLFFLGGESCMLSFDSKLEERNCSVLTIKK